MSQAAVLSKPISNDSGLTGDQLADVLEVFSLIIERCNTVPALSHVRLLADGKTLTIIGTDLDHQLTARIACDADAFDRLAPHSGLLASAKCLGSDVFEFVRGDRELKLSGAAGDFTLDTLPSKDMPSITRGAPDAVIELRRGLFLSALQACKPAISGEETRYYLNGVCLKQVGDALEFAATDGHRLHVATRKPEVIDGAIPESIIHSKAVRCIISLLERSDESAVIELAPKRASVVIGDWTLETNCIDGTFPNYKRVIPEDVKGSFSFAVDDLLSAVKSIKRVTSDRSAYIKLEPTSGRVSHWGMEGFKFERSLAGTAKGELPVAIGFNVRFVAHVLDTHPHSQATMRFLDEATPTPVVFDGDDDFVAVLMPVRL